MSYLLEDLSEKLKKQDFSENSKSNFNDLRAVVSVLIEVGNNDLESQKLIKDFFDFQKKWNLAKTENDNKILLAQLKSIFFSGGFSYKIIPWFKRKISGIQSSCLELIKDSDENGNHSASRSELISDFFDFQDRFKVVKEKELARLAQKQEESISIIQNLKFIRDNYGLEQDHSEYIEKELKRIEKVCDDLFNNDYRDNKTNKFFNDFYSFKDDWDKSRKKQSVSNKKESYIKKSKSKSKSKSEFKLAKGKGTSGSGDNCLIHSIIQGVRGNPTTTSQDIALAKRIRQNLVRRRLVDSLGQIMYTPYIVSLIAEEALRDSEFTGDFSFNIIDSRPEVKRLMNGRDLVESIRVSSGEPKSQKSEVHIDISHQSFEITHKDKGLVQGGHFAFLKSSSKKVYHDISCG